MLKYLVLYKEVLNNFPWRAFTKVLNREIIYHFFFLLFELKSIVGDDMNIK